MGYHLKDILEKTAIWTVLTAIFCAWIRCSFYYDELMAIGGGTYAALVFFYSQLALPINLVISYVVARAYYTVCDKNTVADLSYSNLYRTKSSMGTTEYTSDYGVADTKGIGEGFWRFMVGIVTFTINWYAVGFVLMKVLSMEN